MNEMAQSNAQPVFVARWHSELAFRVLVWIAALLIWALLAVSIVGFFYAALFAFIFFFAHLAFITHLRGNAIRLGPEQMPELYERVVVLSRRIGMKTVPDAYVLQAGGSLNALATKFFRSNFIVLFSDLLDACGENTDARDFIIAHELGHLHAGHLKFRSILAPGLFVPLLGTAYSRACEYTCDRYGLAAADDKERALDGLSILAAGGVHGPRVNRQALVAQRRDLNTVWMKIGHWLSTHPPIPHRMAALQPALGQGYSEGSTATLGAVALMVVAFVVPNVAMAGFVAFALLPEIQKTIAQTQEALQATNASTDADAVDEARLGIASLVTAAEHYRSEHGSLPPSDVELYDQWILLNPLKLLPIDPFDGERYGYESDGQNFTIWSSGTDLDGGDLRFQSGGPQTFSGDGIAVQEN